MKKKFLLLVTSVLLLSFVLCSCNNSFVKEVEKNPTETIFKSIKDSAENIVSENSALDTVISSLHKGSVAFSVSDGTESIGATIYNDVEENKFALLFESMVLAGSESQIPDFNVYANGTEVMVSSKDLLGETVYGLDIKTLYDDLSNSTLWDNLGISFEEFDAEYGEDIQSIINYLTENEDVEKIDKKKLAEIVKKLDEKVISVEQVENAVVVTYDFETEDINEIVDMILEYLKELEPEFFAEFESDGEELNAAYLFEDEFLADYTASVKVYLNAKTEDVMKFEINYKYSELGYDYEKYYESENFDDMVQEVEVIYDGSFVFDFGEGMSSANKCDITIITNENNLFDNTQYVDKRNTTISKKTTTDGNILYEISAFVRSEYDNSAWEEMVNLSLLINTTDKTFKYSNEDSSDIRSISGYFEVKDKALSVAITSIKVYSYYEDCELEGFSEDYLGITELKISFEKDNTVEFPKSYTKITDMTLEELMSIIEKFDSDTEYSDDVLYTDFQ